MAKFLPRQLVTANLAVFYRIALHEKMPVKTARRLMDAASASAPMPSGSVVRKLTLGGRPAERVTVGASERPRAILYLHGGGYTLGSLVTHRSLTGYLARETAAVVFALDYRLAPENPYPAALDDAVAAFMDIVSTHGFAPEQIAIAGDSAGGGLAVATARRLIDEYHVTPGALALLSPWTDPTDESMPRERDLVVNKAWGRISAHRYLGTNDPHTPGFAPVHGNLAGLPATLIHVGSSEILLPQIRRFADTARDAGVDVTLQELPLLWHSGHSQAGVVREAAQATQQVGMFLRIHLDAHQANPVVTPLPAPRSRRRRQAPAESSVGSTS